MNNSSPFYSKEEPLGKNLQLYHEIINSTPLCIKVFDKNGKLIFINKGGREEHFIKDTDDISKWDWMVTLKEEYKSIILKAFQDGLNGESSRVEMKHTPEGSTHQWCEGIISSIKDSKGDVILLLLYSLDITSKKLAEIELKKMNDLMVGRELDMIKLKERIKAMEQTSTTTG